MKNMPEEKFQILNKFFEIIASYDLEKSNKILDYKTPENLKKILNLKETQNTQDYDIIFDWIKKYLKYSVKTSDIQFYNRMWSPTHFPAILGEITTLFAHTSACTYESAPVSTVMENFMIEEMIALVGFKNAEGQMTTGSSNSNMIAMMSARNKYLKTVKSEGLFGQKKLVAFVNEEAHYSMDKAVNILGIGTENLIKIPVDKNGKMKTEILEQEIKKVLKEKNIPFFVGATAGTTMRGAYDNIFKILKLREKYKFWLHVDGAWGGSVFLSPTLKEKFMPQIEEVDSFTWDFHKMHGIPLICNFLLINKHKNILQKTISTCNTDYIFYEKENLKKDENENNKILDSGISSLQCGRRVDILKLFLSWKFYGKIGFQSRIENFLDLAKTAEKIIQKNPDLELTVPRESFNVCFRMKMPENKNNLDINHFNKSIREKLYKSGISMVGFGTLENKLTMRLLISNELTTEKDLEIFFENYVNMGKEILEN